MGESGPRRVLCLVMVVTWAPAPSGGSPGKELVPRLVSGLVPQIDPLGGLGGAAAQVLGDVWMSAMVALWSAGLWVLRMAFWAVDALTTPDLSPEGPLRPALGITLWLGATVAVLMMVVQTGLLLVRRDGQSLGRLLLGLFQFGFVWVTFLAGASTAVAACSGLSRGILQATLHVSTLSAIDWTSSWPRNVTDTTTATVLGITSVLLIIPGSFFDILIAFVGEAALLVLVVTSPITAAGLVNETTRVWWWKTLRWFTACVLIGPTSSLVFGVGAGITKGVVYGYGDRTVAAVGTAVVGGALVIVAACCPLALFRLLAFVDPGTPSGAAVRQSWADATRTAHLTGAPAGGGGGGAVTGTSAATAGDGTGRAQGEAHAEDTALSRVSSVLGMAGRGIQVVTAFATRATDVSADILGAAGVGAPSYSMTAADERALRAGQGAPRGARNDADGGPTTGRGPTPGPSSPGPSSPGSTPSGSMPPGAPSPGSSPAGPGPSGSPPGGPSAGGPSAGAGGAGGPGPVIVP